jgi:hypothetical protein
MGLLHRLTRRLVVAALAAAALPLMSGPPALAVPAAPTQLSPDSTTVGGQPLLEWHRVKTAAEYDVEISTQPDFDTTIYDETTSNSRATPTEALPSGDLYWRVRGVTSNDVRGPWATASFSQDVVMGPALLGPEDGAQLQQPDEPPLLSWQPITGATSYTVEWDNDDQFVDAESETVKTNAYTLPDPGPQQTYYWHVRADLSGDVSSDWSQARSFDVLALAAPILTYPDDSATTQVQDIVLDWKPVAGAVKYEVRVSPDDNFPDETTESATVVSTRYSPPTTFDNDQYWWQVRAIDVNNNKSPWATSANQFQRNWPNRPQLIAPIDGGSVSGHFYYQWDPVPHASTYRLDFGTDGAFSPNTFKTCLTAATTFTPGRVDMRNCTPLQNGTYYWRVRALDGPATPDINGIFSDIHSFHFDQSPVTQLTPPYDPDSPGSIPAPDVPILSWEPYQDMEKYKVQVYKANGDNAASTTTYSTSWVPTGNNRLDPEDGPFRWTVQALARNTGETPVLLEEFQSRFSLSGSVTDDPGTPALTPTSPNGSHTYRFPVLTWEPYLSTDPSPVPAAYYQVFVAGQGSESYRQLADKFPFPAAVDDVEAGLSSGTYHWFANAYSSGGVLLESGFSKQGTFTIDPLDSVTGMRVSLTGQGLESPDSTCERNLDGPAPVCGNLQQTPILRWNPVPEASHYMVYLARDRELTNMADVTNTTTVSNTFMPVELLPDSQAGTAYYWVIRACKAQNTCEPEPTEATNAFDKRSNPVTGLTEREHESTSIMPPTGPGGSADFPEFADEIVLSWDDYLATNQAGNDADVTGMGSTVEAMSYEVEMGSNPNFPSADTVKSGPIDQTTFTPWVKTVPEGPFYWRVRAIDGDDNSLPWSEPRAAGGAAAAIEKRSPTPTLVSPLGGVVVSQTPALRWNALAYAAKYDLQISPNGDTTFSSPLISVHVTQTSYVPTSVTLPASGSPYVWRVRRQDVNNRAGEWSTPRSFSVAAEAPTKVTPTSNVYVAAKDALFTWMPSPGASSYRFERRAIGSTSSQENVTTVGLNWAPTRTIPDGTYEWRVSSFDAGNKLLAASAWSQFTVDETAPTVRTKSPTNLATPTSTFKVGFSEKVTGVASATYALYLKGNPHKLPAKVKVTDRRKGALLIPQAKLKVGKEYTIKLTKGIKDAAGHSLKTTSWTVEIRRP